MDERPVAVVVDDSTPFLKYLSILLNRMNLEVLEVNNALEALELARVVRPRLMTFDLAMKGMNGLDLLRAIRQDKDLAGISVIMITGCMDKSQQWEALSLGCIDVLEKPLELRRLHKAVQKSDLYPGGRRLYLRVPFERPVELHCDGRVLSVDSSNLSERGIFVHIREPLVKGTRVDIDLPLSPQMTLRITGSVVHGRSPEAGDDVDAYGIAIKFDRLNTKETEVLSTLVTGLLIGDIVTEQTEPVVKTP